MIRDQLKKDLEKLVEGKVVIEHPTDPTHGDFSTNVAMRMEGNPLENAKKLLSEWKKPPYIEKAEVAPPGFINFWLSKAAFGKELELALKSGERYGEGDFKAGTKVIIEYTDPNPFKEFHIGHLFTNAAGESLACLFEAGGARVKRANYQGDVGLHVAKAIYGMMHKFKSEKSDLTTLEKKPLADRVKFLGEAYTLGDKAFDGDKAAKAEIQALNQKIYELDPTVSEMYEKGRAWSLEAFEILYKRLGTKFDLYYFERDSGSVGEEIVKKNTPSVFKKDDGAIIFEGERYGLHNRVFINSQGLPTYEAKDLGLAIIKYKDFQYDASYIVTGNEVSGYFKVVLEALSKIDPDLSAKTHHIGHGMVRLPEGKMSSRTGQVLTAEWLLGEAKKRLQKDFPEMINGVADQVGVGAVKYALLRSALGQDITFDFKKSLSFEGDSGPYLQYTFARTQSVLAKSKVRQREATRPAWQKSKVPETNPEAEAILRHFYKFPEVVQEAAENYAPNLVCNFLFELAQKYNAFYNKHRILDPRTKNKEQRDQIIAFRLALTQITGNILKSGLGLLGIQAPERM